MAGNVSPLAKNKARSIGVSEGVCTDIRTLLSTLHSGQVGLDALLETAALAANYPAVQLLLREAEKKELLIAPETLQEAVRAYSEYRSVPSKKADVLKIVQAIAAVVDDLGEFSTPKAFVRVFCPDSNPQERDQLARAINAGMRSRGGASAQRPQTGGGVFLATALLVAAGAVVVAARLFAFSSRAAPAASYQSAPPAAAIAPPPAPAAPPPRAEAPPPPPVAQPAPAAPPASAPPTSPPPPAVSAGAPAPPAAAAAPPAPAEPPARQAAAPAPEAPSANAAKPASAQEVPAAVVPAHSAAPPAAAAPAPASPPSPAAKELPAGAAAGAAAAPASSAGPGALLSKVFSLFGSSGSGSPGAAGGTPAGKTGAGGGSRSATGGDADAQPPPKWPPKRSPKEMQEHETVLEQLGLKAEVAELRARRRDVQDAVKLAAARAKEAAATKKAADAAEAAEATARQKEAEASDRKDFLAADKHKTEAMEKRKAASRLRAEADTSADKHGKAEGDERSRRRRLAQTEEIVEGQGVAAAEFRLVQLQMRIYDLEFNLGQATGVDYKGAARYHDELEKVRREKEALLRHFTFFIDPDVVLHNRGSASRARMEMLPAGGKGRTDIAAAAEAGGKGAAKGGKPASSSSSSILAALSRIGGGWRKRAGAEDVAAGRDEDKWLPYLGLEKELTDLKARRKGKDEAVAAAAALEKRERQAVQRAAELEEALGNARASLEEAKGRDDVEQAKRYHALSVETAAALRLAASEAASVAAELQSAQDEAYARATALFSLESSLEAQERTLSKAKARQLSETLRVADEFFRHALDRDDMDQAEALQKQAGKAKAEKEALEAIYAQLWRSAGPEQGGAEGGGGGEGGSKGAGAAQQQQPVVEEEKDIVLVPAEIAAEIGALSEKADEGYSGEEERDLL